MSEPSIPNARKRAAGRPPARRHRRILIEWITTLGAAVLLAALLHAFVLQAFYIPSASMVPTLDIGARVLVQKGFFSWHDLREGSIVVFTHPPRDVHCGPEGSDLVKRVIALPGQTIYSIGNSIYVDGRRLPEPYLPRFDPLGRPIPSATRQDPFHVPAGEFYVLGDDRQISCDSRYWGPVKGTSIVGKVVLLWWRHGHPDLRLF